MSEKICFVVSPIGEEGSPTRERANTVLDYVIKPAVESLGYRAVRADGISEAGMITSQIIQYIIEAPLVIADLTERNPNVFYELALRHVQKKPVVHLLKKGDPLPFDVGQVRIIPVDTDVASADAAKKEIVKQVLALEKEPEKQQNPISMSMDLKALQTSNKPQERSIGDMMSMLKDIHASVVMLQARGDEVARIRDVQFSQMLDETAKLKQTLIEREKQITRFMNMEIRFKTAVERLARLHDDLVNITDFPLQIERTKYMDALERTSKAIKEILETDDLIGSIRKKVPRWG